MTSYRVYFTGSVQIDASSPSEAAVLASNITNGSELYLEPTDTICETCGATADGDDIEHSEECEHRG
jgi:hypothetical protein